MDIFCRISGSRELGRPIRKDLTPLEFKLSDLQLSEAMGRMRREFKRACPDRKSNTKNFKFILSFVQKERDVYIIPKKATKPKVEIKTQPTLSYEYEAGMTSVADSENRPKARRGRPPRASAQTTVVKKAAPSSAGIDKKIPLGTQVGKPSVRPPSSCRTGALSAIASTARVSITPCPPNKNLLRKLNIRSNRNHGSCPCPFLCFCSASAAFGTTSSSSTFLASAPQTQALARSKHKRVGRTQRATRG
ncbi:hypothetical protein BJ912DRAFT_954694 [Pholiota molesta]|nr:hypothetical protein BJ912DRAFT_954694 [Pholiota molesta]